MACDFFGDNSGLLLFKFEDEVREQCNDILLYDTEYSYEAGIDGQGVIITESNTNLIPVDIPAQITDISFSFWFKNFGTNGGSFSSAIFRVDASNGTEDIYYYQVGVNDRDNIFQLTIFDGFNLWLDFSNYILPVDGLWHHCVIAVNNSSLFSYLYIDGVQEDSISGTWDIGPMNTITQLLFDGLNDPAGTPVLDHLRVLNKRITDEEIQELYEEFDEPIPPAVATHKLFLGEVPPDGYMVGDLEVDKIMVGEVQVYPTASSVLGCDDMLQCDDMLIC